MIVPMVLAAGASSRMGRPKALLDFDGRAAVELVLAACAGGGVAAPVVVVPPEAGALGARISAAAPDATVVVNPRPERGQTSSLQEGLRRLPAGSAAFLIFPVDYVLVQAKDVRVLAQAFAGRTGTDQQIFIPSFQRRRGHPVLVDAALAPAFLALPESGSGGSAREVLRDNVTRIVHVEVDSDRVIHDMDTPDDYQARLDRHRQRR